MKHRPERLGKLIQEELNLIILRELEFPEAVLTITDVIVSRKLEHAKVKVSVWPSDKAAAVMKILKAEQNRLQYLLMKKIRIKMLPKIAFELDRGNENAASVEKALLDQRV